MANYSKTLTESFVVADSRTWNDMSLTWDSYTLTWDDYGDMPATKILVAIRIFTETIANTEAFSRIAVAHRTFTNSISHTETLIKKPIKKLTETITHTEIFGKIATLIRTFTETINHTETIGKIVKRILSDAYSLTDSLIKQPLKRLSETLGLTETFGRISTSIRILTETINIKETDWTWDMMTGTWDEYTENWDYYSKAFNIIKILVRSVSDSLTMTGSILVRAMSMIKGFAMKIVGAVPFGLVKSTKISGKMTTENSFGKISSQDLSGKIEDENLFGKIRNS